MRLGTVASRNPVQVQVSHNAFTRTYPREQLVAEPVSTPSGVNHQPLSVIEVATHNPLLSYGLCHLLFESEYDQHEECMVIPICCS